MMEFMLPGDLTRGTMYENKTIGCLNYASDKASHKTRIVVEGHLFSFLQAGEKIVHHPGGILKIEPSAFLFMPAGNCLMSEKVAHDGRYNSCLLFFHHTLLSNFFSEYFTTVKVRETDMVDRFPRAIMYDTYVQSFVTSLQHLPGKRSADMLALKVQEILLYLCTQYPPLVTYFKHLSMEWEEDNEIRRAVLANIDTAISVQELAFLCNMSLSTFKRKFIKLYGVAPRQWFLQQRMERAAGLLLNSGRKASEIYDELGYENLSSFIQTFKQFYGTTPKQYQINH
ncbi:AraC-like DNA-binding protein [Chitinophaga skermanii]|uniref:AraC-like DNA-binding protein n=1 Tax=Chitinophaga skermanii TaxID=331697 RepID=A0A327QM49_9BACT|nr:AraC family transcriptional regulator [Chitinophaga skermanii]RAJ05410.1 AraC-like DNA-binding protein [Chitinophaga skermanii]